MAATLGIALWVGCFGFWITAMAAKSGCPFASNSCSYCGKDGPYGVKAVCTRKHLEAIPSGLPRNLTYLDAHGNAIKKLTANSLEKFEKLKVLRLGHNTKLHKIENYTFRTQRSLEELHLDANALVQINQVTFFGLGALTYLDLSHNKIEGLIPGNFKALVSVKQLKLGKNRIQSIPAGTFDGLSTLEKLELNGNHVKRLGRGSLGNLMSLKDLRLDRNNLEDVSSGVFTCAPLVRSLTLNNNKLGAVPRAVRSLGFLKNLSLEFNPITSIDSDAFHGLERLEILNLTNCSISTLQNLSFLLLEQVKGFSLALQNNPLHCDCNLGWLAKWTSTFPPSSIRGTVCKSPDRLRNRVLSTVHQSEFLCTCGTCVELSRCVAGLANCTCDRAWTGNSCDAVCNPSRATIPSAIVSSGTYLCQNESAPQTEVSPSRCSFNKTDKPCGEHAEVGKVGDSLDCACQSGFTGDGMQCGDIDECETHVSGCVHQSTCVNTVGSYRCQCLPGHEPEAPTSHVCKDVNECLGPGRCHVNSKCYNTVGSYKCICLDGYEGDGKSCLPKPNKPVNVSATPLDKTRALVTWSISNSSLVAFYHVQIKDLMLNQRWDGQEGVILSRNASSITLDDLRYGRKYRVRVGAFSKHNISTYSDGVVLSLPSHANDSNTYVVPTIAAMGAVVLAALLVICALHGRSKKGACCTRRDTRPAITDLTDLGARAGPTPADSELEATKASSDTKDKWEISRDKLEIGQRIGEGQFGMVFEGTLLSKDGSIKVAIKTLKFDADRFDYKDLVQEMEMMKAIGQHPNVVTFIGACTNKGPLYIITEYIAGGNLLDYLRASRVSGDAYVNVISSLSPRELLKIALDVARGMSHVAKKKFVHRDLAARNVLLTEGRVAKVADFGLARDVYTEGKYVKTGGGRVPVKWMAPESIEHQLYTTRSDVWSFGVLLWEIMTIGTMPYRCLPVNLLLTKLLCGYRLEKPPKCSEEMYEVMQACWRLDPDKRPTFDELCDVLIDMLSVSARAYVNVVATDEELQMPELETV